MKILVIKMSALGDVIQALPVIPALKRAFPHARIHWLVEEVAEPVVRSHPGIDGVLVSRRGKWGRDLRDPRRWRKALGEVGALVGDLRRGGYDLAVDLQGLLKSGIWMALASARRKVGYDGTREGSDVFLTDRVPRVSLDVHAVERYLLLVEAVGAGTGELSFGLSVPAGARSHLRELLVEQGWDSCVPYAVLVPAARWESKQWGAAPFAALADRLVDDLGLHVAITGVQTDRPLVEDIVRRMNHPALDLAGRTDMPTLMALQEEAQVVVSTDSGPMHLAAAMGTPVVALFGPTAPWRTGPYGRRHRVIRAGVACSPCFRRECPHRRCMERIRPEQVAEAVADLMHDAQGAGG